MNLAHIQAHYPRAYAELLHFLAADPALRPREVEMRAGWHQRLLYDFFDARQILIETFWHGTDAETLRWVWTLTPDFTPTEESVTEYPSRPEAETAAFTCAFELLEKRLAP